VLLDGAGGGGGAVSSSVANPMYSSQMASSLKQTQLRELGSAGNTYNDFGFRDPSSSSAAAQSVIYSIPASPSVTNAVGGAWNVAQPSAASSAVGGGGGVLSGQQQQQQEEQEQEQHGIIYSVPASPFFTSNAAEGALYLAPSSPVPDQVGLAKARSVMLNAVSAAASNSGGELQTHANAIYTVPLEAAGAGAGAGAGGAGATSIAVSTRGSVLDPLYQQQMLGGAVSKHIYDNSNAALTPGVSTPYDRLQHGAAAAGDGAGGGAGVERNGSKKGKRRGPGPIVFGDAAGVQADAELYSQMPLSPISPREQKRILLEDNM